MKPFISMVSMSGKIEYIRMRESSFFMVSFPVEEFHFIF